jgi:hypothetical protein
MLQLPLVKENVLNVAEYHPPFGSNGIEAGRQKFSAFGFMNQKLNVMHSVFKHVKESVCSSDNLFCVCLDGYG